MDVRQVCLTAMISALTACGGDSPDSLQSLGTIKTTTIAPPVGPPLSNIVAFMGDSITARWDLQDYDTTNPVLNFGIGNQTSVQMLGRFNEVLSSGAGVVVIEGGINDLYLLGPNMANIDSIANMAAQAKAAGIRVILTSLMPDSFSYATGTAPTEFEIFSMSEALETLAQSDGYLYADFFDAMRLPDGAQDPSLTIDGLHPNAAGYAKLWAVLEPLIAEDLK